MHNSKNFKLKYLVIIVSIIAGYFILFYFNPIPENRTICIFKNITGQACPACGSTRATQLIFQGKIQQSILINPLALISNIGILISIVWMIVDIAKNKETLLPFLCRDWALSTKITIMLIIIINWLWSISKGI